MTKPEPTFDPERQVSAFASSSKSDAAQLPVRIWRGTADGGFQQYVVPRHPSQTVLDVVTHVQRHIDPSLAYRYACRVGMCGSCAMTVNGKARWTCRTHVDVVSNQPTLEIAPLSNLPIVRDLVVDMAPFFDKWAAARGAFIPSSTRNDDFAKVRPGSPKRRAIDATIECIGCAVCYASCDVVSWKPDYLGPAALNRAFTLMNDVRDADANGRLQAIASDAGCQACHTHESCTERCPKHLTPTASIAALKRMVTVATFKGTL